jgi:DNA-3-methyladenine glycosylase
MSKDQIGDILPRSFYTRLDATVIARELLGKVIITSSEEGDTAGVIVETEAYMGPDDLACHAHSNRITPRNKTMYDIGGTSYVYICYGMHNLFNAVTGKEGMGHAVLIRAVEPLLNETLMVSRRRKERMSRVITNGPGKLSTALGITKEWNGLDLTDLNSPIFIVDGRLDRDYGEIEEGPRVGMSHHTKHCGHFPWRYKYSDNKWTSKPDQVSYNW